MANSGKSRSFLLTLAMVGLAIAATVAIASTRSGTIEWLMRLWPMFLVCAGVIRVMGFAVERKPATPTDGLLLIFVGVLFLLNRFHSELNGIQIYGRYWILFLLVFAAVELVRHYTHSDKYGPPPKLFTPLRVIVVGLLVITGALANRIASTNPSLLSALKLPGLLDGFRDSVIGREFTFSESSSETNLRRGGIVRINNSYGSVRVVTGTDSVRVSLTKGVRGWNEDEARKIADQIRLVVIPTTDGVSISTNRDQLTKQFTTDLLIQVPSDAPVSIGNSYGPVSVTGVGERVELSNSHGNVELTNIAGNIVGNLNYSDINISNAAGDVQISGAKKATLANIVGALSLKASNSSVEVRDVGGPVRIEAPFCRIKADRLGEASEIFTDHASVVATNVGDMVIRAPNSDVRVEDSNGNIKITTSNSEVRVKGISGDLTLNADQCSVSAEELRGMSRIATSHGDVSVRNFVGGLDIKTSFKRVKLFSSTPPAGDINVENNHGAIELHLPESSQFRLDAISQGGEIKPQGFAALVASPGEVFNVSVGESGPRIKLRTSYSTITIKAAQGRQVRAVRVVPRDVMLTAETR